MNDGTCECNKPCFHRMKRVVIPSIFKVPWFELTFKDFETDTTVKKAVCFSPSKRPGNESLAPNKSGCVISNARTNNDALMISEYSTVEERDLGFEPKSTNKFTDIFKIINELPLDINADVVGHAILDEPTVVGAIT